MSRLAVDIIGIIGSISFISAGAFPTDTSATRKREGN